MMKKLTYFIVLILLCMGVWGCSSKSDDDKTIGVTTTEKSTEKEENTPETEKYKFDYDHIYDGINRIAISIYKDSATRIGMSWYTPNKEGYGNDIEIIEKDTLKLCDVEYDISSGVAAYDETSMYHQTAIKGLTPGTEYYYRIGDKKANEWSDYGTFTTAADDIKEFQFVAITDTQGSHLPDAYYSANTIKRALEVVKKPAFIMHSGDYVDDGNDEKLWLALMNAAKDSMMNNIIVPAVGNHEVEDHAFWQHFKLEHTNDHKTTGIYYSFNYGNTHFVVLDTNKSTDDNTSYIDDEQLEWLEDDLKKARENGSKWIIVNMHKGLYTIGKHSDNEKFDGENGARNRVGSVFEKYGVNLVIQGHDHCPSVSKPIKDGKASEDGVVYINTGSAGSKSYGVDDGTMPDEYYELFDYMPTEERTDDTYQNFAIVSITDDGINVKMYESNQLAIENNTYILKELNIK